MMAAHSSFLYICKSRYIAMTTIKYSAYHETFFRVMRFLGPLSNNIPLLVDLISVSYIKHGYSVSHLLGIASCHFRNDVDITFIFPIYTIK